MIYPERRVPQGMYSCRKETMQNLDPYQDEPCHVSSLLTPTHSHAYSYSFLCRYMAPEVAKRKPYNAKADVFGFAMLLWQLLALEKPFANQPTSEAALGRIVHGDRPSLKKIQELPLPAEDVQTLQQLIQQGWSKKIEERPTMEQFRLRLADLVPEEGVLLSSSDRSTSGDEL